MIRVLRDHLISFCCLSKGNLMGNDIGKTDSFLSKQADKLLDIATFCEAHIADRVINSLLLIGRIITSCSIRTGNAEGKLSLIVRSSVNVHLGYTDHADNTAVTGNGCRQIHGCIGIGCCGDDDFVHTASSGQCLGHINSAVIAGIDKCLQVGTWHGLIHHVIANDVTTVSI